MKIVILSDIHDELENLEKCLDFCNRQNIEQIICAGDVTNYDTIVLMSEKFKKTIYLVKGNMCFYRNTDLDLLPNITFFGREGFFRIGDRSIGLCHYPDMDLLQENSYDIFFYGHTHQAREHFEKNTRLINPGSVSGGNESSFCIWDTSTDIIEFKYLKDI